MTELALEASPHDAPPSKFFRGERRPKTWSAWMRRLGKRASQADLFAIAPGGRSPFAWFEIDGKKPRSGAAFAGAHGAVEESPELAEFLSATDDGRLAVAPEKVVYWAYRLGRRPTEWTPDDWLTLFRRLIAIAADAQEHAPSDVDAERLLLCGELPAVLSHLFPEVRSAWALRRDARRALAASLLDPHDGEGVLDVRSWSAAPSFWASWTRLRLLFGADLPWNAKAEQQFQFALRQALRHVSGDGALAWSEPRLRPTRALLAIWNDLADDDDYAAAAAERRLLRPGDVSTKSKSTSPPDAGIHSEWAGCSVLAAGWKPSRPKLFVAHAGDRCHLELAAGKSLLGGGEYDFTVRCDGKELQPRDEYGVVLWEDDEDVAYLELEIELSGGARLQRQMLLAKQDRMLLLADALLGDGEQRDWEVGCSLPLASGVQLTPADDAHEARIQVGEKAYLAFPLAASEWRGAPSDAVLACENDRITWSRSVRGRHVFNPLWICLKPAALQRPFTWRQLTVAEQRLIIARDVAVGYRVQHGSNQWALYRSLEPAASRTLLGCNLVYQFMLGKFTTQGTVEPLLEIE